MKWPEVELEKVANVTGGGTPRRNEDRFWGSGIPWVTPTDLPEIGSSIVEVERTRETITQEGLGNSSANLLPAGSVLFSSRATIGKVAIAKVPLATNQGFVNFVPRAGVDARFLVHALQFFTPQIAALAGSTTFREVSRGALRKFKIPVPPLSEQRRIVEILDRADELRQKRDEADAKAERIPSALFYRMFGDPATNPKSWARCRVGDLLAETIYGTSAPSNSEGRGPIVIRMGNICSDGWIDLGNLKHIEIPETELTKLRLQLGDLLFNRTNSRELVGKTGIWLDTTLEAVPASYLIRLRTRAEVASPEFVWAYMNTGFIKRLILDMARRAIGMANINATEVRSMPAFLPPLDEQRKFAIALSRTEKLRRARLERGTRLELLATVLSARAFSGTLTAKWREGRLKELLSEMADQARAMGQGSEQTKEPASP
jgi:type I restriction enzyme S subunit